MITQASWTMHGKEVVSKSLEQWRNDASGGDPWACQKCGCRDWRVHRTRELISGNIRRIRVCRNCGGRMKTEEKPDG